MLGLTCMCVSVSACASVRAYVYKLRHTWRYLQYCEADSVYESTSDVSSSRRTVLDYIHVHNGGGRHHTRTRLEMKEDFPFRRIEPYHVILDCSGTVVVISACWLVEQFHIRVRKPVVAGNDAVGAKV